MTSKFLSLVAGVSALALAGAASAAEPMQLTDTQLDGVTAGTYVKPVAVTSYKNLVGYTNNFIKGVTIVYGNGADATAGADAYGWNTITYTTAYAATTPYSSTSYSGASAGSN
jgi:hypothetical protein